MDFCHMQQYEWVSSLMLTEKQTQKTTSFMSSFVKKIKMGIEEYFEVIEKRHEENFCDDEKLYVIIGVFYRYTHVL